MKTSELTGDALDWAVAKCEGHMDDIYSWLYEATLEEIRGGSYHPSTSWGEGGPIIEREKFGLFYSDDVWLCDPNILDFIAQRAYGPTPLVAAMRCFVASKLGDEIEIPKELT